MLIKSIAGVGGAGGNLFTLTPVKSTSFFSFALWSEADGQGNFTIGATAQSPDFVWNDLTNIPDTAKFVEWQLYGLALNAASQGNRFFRLWVCNDNTYALAIGALHLQVFNANELDSNSITIKSPWNPANKLLYIKADYPGGLAQASSGAILQGYWE